MSYKVLALLVQGHWAIRPLSEELQALCFWGRYYPKNGQKIKARKLG
jgi:hypothetical protein